MMKIIPIPLTVKVRMTISLFNFQDFLDSFDSPNFSSCRWLSTAWTHQFNLQLFNGHIYLITNETHGRQLPADPGYYVHKHKDSAEWQAERRPVRSTVFLSYCLLFCLPVTLINYQRDSRSNLCVRGPWSALKWQNYRRQLTHV